MWQMTRRGCASLTLGLAAAAGGALVWGLAQAARPTAARGNEADRTLTVVGIGTANLPPDQAEMRLGVRVMAHSAQEATHTGSEAMAKMIALLKARGVADRHIRTSFFQVTPEYRERPKGGGMERIGHTATNSLDVTITTLDTVGDILDAVIETGGDSIVIDHVQLTSSNPQAAQDEARRAALREVRRVATLLAEEMGVTLGSVLRIQPQSDHVPGPRLMRAMFFGPAVPGPAVPVESGEMTVTATIEVIFALR
jgi:uncharacterized protein YggE